MLCIALPLLHLKGQINLLHDCSKLVFLISLNTVQVRAGAEAGAASFFTAPAPAIKGGQGRLRLHYPVAYCIQKQIKVDRSPILSLGPVLPGDLQPGRRDQPEDARVSRPHALRPHHPHGERATGLRGVREPQPQAGLLPGPPHRVDRRHGRRCQDLLTQVRETHCTHILRSIFLLEFMPRTLRHLPGGGPPQINNNQMGKAGTASLRVEPTLKRVVPAALP